MRVFATDRERPETPTCVFNHGHRRLNCPYSQNKNVFLSELAPGVHKKAHYRLYLSYFTCPRNYQAAFSEEKAPGAMNILPLCSRRRVQPFMTVDTPPPRTHKLDHDRPLPSTPAKPCGRLWNSEPGHDIFQSNYTHPQVSCEKATY